MDEDAATALARRIDRDVRRLLARRVRSVILHGSLTLGDFVAGTSDVDLLAIVDGQLSDGDVGELVGAVARHATEARIPVDLRVVTSAVAARPGAAPPMELYVRAAPPSEPEVERRVERVPDLAVELSVCREHGRALSGAPPAEVIGEVAPESIVGYGRSLLAHWRAGNYDERHEQLVVFTACRAWLFAAEARHVSKPVAAAWVLDRAPELRAVQAALEARRGESRGRIANGDVHRLLAAAGQRLDR